jgi:hypothetical protein
MRQRGRNPSITSPVYESQPYPYNKKTRHHPNPSDAFTESSIASSTDEPDPHSRQMRPNGNTIPTGAAFAFGKKHSTNPSFSDMSTTTTSDVTDTENAFGLDSAGFVPSSNNKSMSSLVGFEDHGWGKEEEEGVGLSEQSTPVLARSTKRFGGQAAREDAGTPSPGSGRRNGN